MEDVHSLSASAFELPVYYGKDRDAFKECINNNEASNPPERLALLGWGMFIREHPRDARRFLSCLEERGEISRPVELLVSPRACSCCGYLTLSDWNTGSWEIGSVGNREDDEVQFRNPNFEGGTQRESLEQARLSFSQNQFSTNETRDFRWQNDS